MKRLVLVRHGATDWSEAGRLTGWADVPLNDRGRAQAESLAARIGKMSLTATWSSDLARAAETAEIIAGPPTTDSRLRELDLGELEGKVWDELAPEVQEELVAFDGFAAPSGESVAQLEARVTSFVGDLDDGTHLVVTHGGVIRLLLRATGAADRPIEPCQVLELVVDPSTGKPIRRIIVEQL